MHILLCVSWYHHRQYCVFSWYFIVFSTRPTSNAFFWKIMSVNLSKLANVCIYLFNYNRLEIKLVLHCIALQYNIISNSHCPVSIPWSINKRNQFSSHVESGRRAAYASEWIPFVFFCKSNVAHESGKFITEFSGSTKWHPRISTIRAMLLWATITCARSGATVCRPMRRRLADMGRCTRQSNSSVTDGRSLPNWTTPDRGKLAVSSVRSVVCAVLVWISAPIDIDFSRAIWFHLALPSVKTIVGIIYWTWKFDWKVTLLDWSLFRSELRVFAVNGLPLHCWSWTSLFTLL